jgi:hypothetical protein
MCGVAAVMPMMMSGICPDTASVTAWPPPL